MSASNVKSQSIGFQRRCASQNKNAMIKRRATGGQGEVVFHAAGNFRDERGPARVAEGCLAGGGQGSLRDFLHGIEPFRAFTVTAQFAACFDKNNPEVPSADANMSCPCPKPGAAPVMAGGNCVRPKGS